LNFARRPFKDYRPVNVTIGLASALGLLLLALNLRDFFAFRHRAAGTRAEITHLNSTAAQIEDSAAQTRTRLAALRLKDLQAESSRLNALLHEKSFSWMLLLSRLEKVLPDEVYITRLSPQIGPDGSARLGMNLVGKSPESIVKTLGALSKDPHFSNAVPQQESDPEKGAPEGFKFHLTVLYSPQDAT
jgi:hypothetical protein